MSAKRIAKEALYQRAVEIACRLFVDADYCVRTKERCHKKTKNCESCVETWLLYKARDEINSEMIKANLEVFRNVDNEKRSG